MKRKSKNFNIFIAIICIILTLFFIRLVRQGYSIYQTHRESVKTEDKVEELEKEQKALSEEKENLGDIKYIEKIAREEHNMVRKGEIPLFIIEDKAEKSGENKNNNSKEKIKDEKPLEDKATSKQ